MTKKKKVIKKKRKPFVSRAKLQQMIANLKENYEILCASHEQLQKDNAKLHQDDRMGQLRPNWTTAEGEVIPIRQMDEEHLRNTIFYLFRRMFKEFGTITYLDHTKRHLLNLVALMEEAERRGMRV